MCDANERNPASTYRDDRFGAAQIKQMFKLDFILIVFEHLDTGAAYIDSDTGLESMSSAEATTKACSLCTDGNAAGGGGGGGGTITIGGGAMRGGMVVGMAPGHAVPESGHQVDGLRQEVTRLKCDKLDLLQQNVVSSCFYASCKYTA